jgi:hypothetical protein
MALPNKVLPGFSATLYAQDGATPTPLTTAELSTYATVSALAITSNQIPVEAIPAFGSDDAVASFGVAGSRQGDKIPVQNAPTSLAVTAAWNPSNANLLELRTDAYNGTIDRTYIIAATDGTNTVYYAFNGRVGNWQIDAQPGAEAKVHFSIHPRGNQFGWSNNT